MTYLSYRILKAINKIDPNKFFLSTVKINMKKNDLKIGKLGQVEWGV